MTKTEETGEPALSDVGTQSGTRGVGDDAAAVGALGELRLDLIAEARLGAPPWEHAAHTIFILRDFSYNASVFYAILVKFINILRDFSHFASVFHAIFVILHQFFTRFELFWISFLGAMREARAVVCRSRENREKSTKKRENREKSRFFAISARTAHYCSRCAHRA